MTASTPTPAPPSGAVAEPLLRPIRESDRISSVDVIRGVAVLGILLLNIVGMGLPFEAYFDPTVVGGATGWSLWSWVVASLFFEGTMRALFSMLFGASVLLFASKDTDKATGVSLADAYYRRVIWLFIFGIIHAYVLLWPGDILYSYGLMGMFLFPFRRLPPAKLFALGAALLLAGAAVYLVESLQVLHLQEQAAAAQEALSLGNVLTPELKAGLDQWQVRVEEMKPSAEAINRVIQAVQGGYFSAMRELAGQTYYYQTVIHYRYDYFDILSMMFLGMALFKWRVFHAELPPGIYAAMVVLGYAVGLTVNWREATLIMEQGFSVGAFYQASTTYDLGRLSMLTGHIGVIMLLCRFNLARRLTRSLAAVGRMALTNYISQTLFTTFVFVGLAQYGEWERYQLYYLVFGIWLFQLTLSPIWLRCFHFGPLEWLWRSLTYLKKQPFWRA